MSVHGLMALSDEELAAVDPALVNLTVARGIPDLANVRLDQYLEVIDAWAQQIERANETALTRGAASEPLYQHDPDLWACGGMAIYLAGPRAKIEYTTSLLDPGDPSQTFLPGLMDTRTGTCANMPVLYLAIGHRLGWPLRAVVSRDHCWVRWDDGEKQFNLEATSASSSAGIGEFASSPDDEYICELGTPRTAIESGSDLTSLTARQTLGVYLQSRAGYWAAHGEWEGAEHDLLLARTCFPENRDIYLFLLEAMSRRTGVMFTPNERRSIAAMLARDPVGPDRIGADHWSHQYRRGSDRLELARRRQAEVDRINRQNTARILGETIHGEPADSGSVLYNEGEQR